MTSELLALLESNRPALLLSALRRTGNRAAAEDAVQDAALCVLRYKGNPPHAPLAWLHTVVRNCARMAYDVATAQKRGGKAGALSIDALPGAGAGLQAPWRAPLIENARWKVVEEGLSPDDREMLEALLIDEESYEAWGRERGMKHGAVKSKVFRTRKRLQTAAARVTRSA